MRRMSEIDGLFLGDDGGARCAWCAATPEYQRYHDEEWGFPVTDDRRLFEKLCLEGFQAGLSWLTILNKREAFRRAFANFDAERVARFRERDIGHRLRLPRLDVIAVHLDMADRIAIVRVDIAVRVARPYGQKRNLVLEWHQTFYDDAASPDARCAFCILPCGRDKHRD